MTKTYEEEVCASGTCNKFYKCAGGQSDACQAETDAYNAYANLKAQKANIDLQIDEKREIWYQNAHGDKTRYNADVKRIGKQKAKEKIDGWKIEFDGIYQDRKHYE